MPFSNENLAAINLLLQFNPPSSLEGIKIHGTAGSEMIAAAAQMHAQGFITQVDGGYLTQLGMEAAEHAHSLHQLLNSTVASGIRDAGTDRDQ